MSEHIVGTVETNLTEYVTLEQEGKCIGIHLPVMPSELIYWAGLIEKGKTLQINWYQHVIILEPSLTPSQLALIQTDQENVHGK